MTIKIADKDLQLTFGMHLGEMLINEATGKQRMGTLAFTTALLFYAHENWCLGNDAEPKLTKGQIFQYLEANNNDEALALELHKVLVEYAASKPAAAINEAGAKPTKKKVAPTTKK